jgi:uncharacterized protein YgbK (DUF1537 family)
VLVVAGSHHPAALRQVEMLQNRPGTIPAFPGSSTFPTGDLAQISRLDAIVLTPDITEYCPGAEAATALALAGAASEWMERKKVSGLVLTGGETAAAVCERLSCSDIDLGGEVQPGMGWGRLADGLYAGLPVVTKAGGFGDESALVEAVHFLRVRIKN